MRSGAVLAYIIPVPALPDAALEGLLQPLWDYLALSDAPRAADVIFVFGSADRAVPARAAALYAAGYAPRILVSGSFGRLTRGRFDRPEAYVFRDLIVAAGVPPAAVITEPVAANTLENVRLGMAALAARGHRPRFALLVAKGFAMRRCLATFAQQFPAVRLRACPPARPLPAAIDRSVPAFAARLVAELERLERYAAQGDIRAQAVPAAVEAVARGVTAALRWTPARGRRAAGARRGDILRRSVRARRSHPPTPVQEVPMRSMLLSLVLVLTAATVALADSRPVDITSADGVVLKGSYYDPGQPGPGMLLVHQCNMDRTSWESLAGSLSAAGIHVLTFDLRGFGETPGEGLVSRDSFPRLLQQSPPDVDAAYAYLLAQDGVDAARTGVGGASCGVALTSDLATRNPDVKAFLALSGFPSDAARKHIAMTPGLAVFGAAADADDLTPGVHEVIKAAVEGSQNGQSMVKIYGGTEHGLPMFGKNPDLEPAIVSWLEAQLLDQD